RAEMVIASPATGITGVRIGLGCRSAKNSRVLRGDRVEDAVEILHRGELDRETTFALSECNLDPRVEGVREPRGELVERGDPVARTRLALCGRRRGLTPPERHDLLRGTDRDPLRDDAQREAIH